jgi:hypothetical protein
MTGGVRDGVTSVIPLLDELSFMAQHRAIGFVERRRIDVGATLGRLVPFFGPTQYVDQDEPRRHCRFRAQR